jgi:signal transduction histidine kinase
MHGRNGMAGDSTFPTWPADTPEQPGTRPDRLNASAGMPAHDVSLETLAGTTRLNADRLRLLAELVPAMGHDISNMLAVVVSSAELARRQCRPVAADLFEAIGMAARNAADLTRTLMQLSGCQAMPAAPDALLDVNLRLQALLPMLDRILPPGSTLHVQLVNASRRAPRWLVRAGAAEFDSAILNLVSNARDALRAGAGGGRVMVRTRNVSLRGQDGSAIDHVLVCMADTGRAWTRLRLPGCGSLSSPRKGRMAPASGFPRCGDLPTPRAARSASTARLAAARSPFSGCRATTRNRGHASL